MNTFEISEALSGTNDRIPVIEDARDDLKVKLLSATKESSP